MPPGAQKSPVLHWAPIIGLAALGGVVLFWFDPGRYGFYPVCVFHRTTGLLCPGCGCLRAVHELLHGRLAAAWHLNALLVLSLPLSAWLAARKIVAMLRNAPAEFSLRPAWVWSALGVILMFGILRNLPFAPLAALAPP